MQRFNALKWLLLGLMISLCLACAHPPPTPPAPPTWRVVANGYFNAVEIDGPFDVELVQSAKNPRAEIFADDLALRHLNAVLKDNTLHLTGPYFGRRGDQRRWLVRIYASDLNRLAFSGTVNINASGLNTSQLLIAASDTSQIYLRGMAGLFELDVPRGNPYVDVRWVNSRNMLIRAHGGNIRLAGATHFIDAKLYGKAQLDAKYLRADTIWIQTLNDSQAEIVATGALRAFAGGRSNVFYYKTPKHQTVVTQISGNVLQMGYWN